MSLTFKKYNIIIFVSDNIFKCFHAVDFYCYKFLTRPLICFYFNIGF